MPRTHLPTPDLPSTGITSSVTSTCVRLAVSLKDRKLLEILKGTISITLMRRTLPPPSFANFIGTALKQAKSKRGKIRTEADNTSTRRARNGAIVRAVKTLLSAFETLLAYLRRQ